MLSIVVAVRTVVVPKRGVPECVAGYDKGTMRTPRPEMPGIRDVP